MAPLFSKRPLFDTLAVCGAIAVVLGLASYAEGEVTPRVIIFWIGWLTLTAYLLRSAVEARRLDRLIDEQDRELKQSQ